jgi:hypothetical protein
MIVGFTGTSQGMTDIQKVRLERILFELFHADQSSSTEFHHGDCVGADEEADEIAESIGYTRVIHPPINPYKRAHCQTKIIWEPKEYLVRNHDIVNCSNIMIACPKEAHEVLRSGTWATIRFANKFPEKDKYLITPSGTVFRFHRKKS